MISYYDGQLADIMPASVMGSPEAKALSHALQQACRLLYRYSQRLYIYASLDEQPEEVVDLLALELRTQYYRNTLDLETKRRLVKNTLVWHMGAGTPEAVEELVATVFGEGKVEEWFEYGGQPYCFKVRTDAILTEGMADYFSKMIQQVKNARSHIDSVEIHRTVGQGQFAGTGLALQYRQAAIIDGYNIRRQGNQKACVAVAGAQNYRPAAIQETK